MKSGIGMSSKRGDRVCDQSGRVKGWIPERLEWEDLNGLLAHARDFALGQIERRRWRGRAGGGVLPEGQDAESVASTVVDAMVRGECRLALGWTRERLERELDRLVSNEIRRLYGLQERIAMRSEWDVLAVDEDGRAQSILPWVPDSAADPCEEAARKEDAAECERVEQEIAGYLDGDAEARAVFECLCDGVSKRRAIAKRLGTSVEAVTAARKRLERKVGEYRSRIRRNGADGS